MSFSTYDELQAKIANWANREDLTEQIKDFIALAETRFNRELRTIEMVKRATATTSNEFVAVPADWVEAKDISIGTKPLQFITADRLGVLKDEKVSGLTQWFTIVGKEIELFPAPSSDVTVEMTYYAKIPSLSASAPTNWLLTKAPDLYLYGALQQAAVFLMDDMRLAGMTANATAIIQFLNNESDNAAHSGGPLVARARNA